MGTDDGETTNEPPAFDNGDVDLAVLINGRVAWRDGQLTDGFGDEAGYGSVLRATV